MPAFRKLPARPGAVGLALTAYDVWRRLTPAQRKRVIQATRKHGPTLARVVAQQARARARRPRT